MIMASCNIHLLMVKITLSKLRVLSHRQKQWCLMTFKSILAIFKISWCFESIIIRVDITIKEAAYVTTLDSLFHMYWVLNSAIQPFFIKSREYEIMNAKFLSWFHVYICLKNKSEILKFTRYASRDFMHDILIPRV